MTKRGASERGFWTVLAAFITAALASAEHFDEAWTAKEWVIAVLGVASSTVIARRAWLDQSLSDQKKSEEEAGGQTF